MLARTMILNRRALSTKVMLFVAAGCFMTEIVMCEALQRESMIV